VLRAARRRGRVSEIPELKSAGLKAERPRRSFLEPEQIVSLLDATSALESVNRGLDWDKVHRIRTSSESRSRSRASSASPTRSCARYD
jgi:hypothetical protein